MDPALNPYSPGAGRKPYALVGRDPDLTAFRTLIARAARGAVDRSIVITGLRGVGKTVLLGEMAARASEAEWVVVQSEAHESDSGDLRFATTLARSLRARLRTMIRRGWSDRLRDAAATFKAFALTLDASGSLSIGIDVDPAQGRADTGHLELDLQELAADLSIAARERNSGIAIFIDEMQDLDKEVLTALCSACHWAGQHEQPFYVIGAGLPNLPRELADARSYAERLFTYRELTPLRREDAEAALVEPAASLEISWDRAASDELLDAAAGYPYFIQEYGRAAWDNAPGPRITVTDAKLALQDGQAHLDRGFFRSRWERATNAERRFLSAMAEDGGSSSSSRSVAARLGKPINAIGPIRASLIRKGIIFSPDYGALAYTVPGMHEFIRRQDGEDRS